jgi:hypothetical protein
MHAHAGTQVRAVRRWLEVLAYPRREVSRVVALRSGASGASTYRVEFGDETLILKVVAPGSPPHILERGWREVLFYRHLAPLVPVRTPEVLASHGPSPDGRAVLLRAYAAPPGIASWVPARYRTAASQLAALHASYWNRTDELHHFAWLRGSGDPARATSPAAALVTWRALWRQQRLADIFDAGTVSAIEAGVDQVDGFRARVRHLGLPLTVCHGDAHHENVLMGADGRWLWADWQEVGVGCGPDDLSFFFQRAAAAGGSPDLPDMLRAYQDELERRCGTRAAKETLEAAVWTCEAVQRLVEWPQYLARASETVVRRHVERTLVLLDLTEALSARSRRSSTSP